MIVSISGPSCAGKTTLLEGLRGALPSLMPMESVTTRPGRPSDQPGEYRYVSSEEFDRLEAQGIFAWTVQPFGGPHRYGTRKLLIESALNAKQVYVPILTFETVDTLAQFAEERRLAHHFRSIYLILSHELSLRERFERRGDRGAEVEARIVAAMQEARTCSEQVYRWRHAYQLIDGMYPKQEVLAQAIYFIQSPQ